MNATSLYKTTIQLILKANPNDPSTWQDLYRLVPYLRNIFCCFVCANILKNPQIPVGTGCQHHVCFDCKSETKKIKSSCKCSQDCNYFENTSLRLLIQCYKRLCIKVLNSKIYDHLQEEANTFCFNMDGGVESSAANLIMLLTEGASFQDDYPIKIGIPKSVYSILPCVYSSSYESMPSSSTVASATHFDISNSIEDVPLFPLSITSPDKNITLKCKPQEMPVPLLTPIRSHSEMELLSSMTDKPKLGCRCGTATAVPGKLTCCGQRCLCYVDKKPCVDCKCRGCRNPHQPDGIKVQPLNSSQLDIIQPLILQAQSQIEQAQSQIEQAQSQIEHTQPQIEQIQPQIEPEVPLPDLTYYQMPDLNFEQLQQNLQIENLDQDSLPWPNLQLDFEQQDLLQRTLQQLNIEQELDQNLLQFDLQEQDLVDCNFQETQQDLLQTLQEHDLQENFLQPNLQDFQLNFQPQNLEQPKPTLQTSPLLNIIPKNLQQLKLLQQKVQEQYLQEQHLEKQNVQKQKLQQQLQQHLYQQQMRLQQLQIQRQNELTFQLQREQELRALQECQLLQQQQEQQQQEQLQQEQQLELDLLDYNEVFKSGEFLSPEDTITLERLTEQLLSSDLELSSFPLSPLISLPSDPPLLLDFDNDEDLNLI